MTVTYSLDVSTSSFFTFFKLLTRWKGSIYKLVYREFAIYLIFYYGIAIVYRFLLNARQQSDFEKVVVYFRKFADYVPMAFVLGFYIWVIIGRWWQQCLNLPWIDRPAFAVAAYVHGFDERGRVIRRNMVRYMNLLSVLALLCMSSPVKKRFPTMQHLVEAGLLTEAEKEKLESVTGNYGNYFIPGAWFSNLAMQARKEGRIHDDIHLKTINDEMQTFRGCCGMLFLYDWVSLPLVYTQVVTIAVYVFFAACLLGRQHLFYEESDVKDYGIIGEYIPLLTMFQFFFYVGWLKTGETLINGLGEDDDDFEVNWIIDRNLQVGYLIADELYSVYPDLGKDAHWNEVEVTIPHTKMSMNLQNKGFLGSVADIEFAPAQRFPRIRKASQLSPEAAQEGLMEVGSPAHRLGTLLQGMSRKASRYGSRRKNSMFFGSRQLSEVSRKSRSGSTDTMPQEIKRQVPKIVENDVIPTSNSDSDVSGSVLAVNIYSSGKISPGSSVSSFSKAGPRSSVTSDITNDTTEREMKSASFGDREDSVERLMTRYRAQRSISDEGPGPERSVLFQDEVFDEIEGPETSQPARKPSGRYSREEFVPLPIVQEEPSSILEDEEEEDES